MVTVGDPGNASVGVSAFGAQGDFIDPPANGGIYGAVPMRLPSRRTA
jgi:hypothetical protein